MSGQVPTIGRIVIVPVDGQRSNGAACAPAIITRVWSDTCVNLRVIADTNSDLNSWRTSCTFVDELPMTDLGATPQAVWTWPPRV